MQPGLTVCMDFEGPHGDAFKDALQANVTVANVDTMERSLAEGAASFRNDSELELDSSRLAIQNQLTIELWIRPGEVPSDQAGLFDAMGQYEINFENDRQIECMLLGGGYDELDSKLKLEVNGQRWYHVACTYDGTNLKVYVDGKVEGCRPIDRTVTTFGSRAAIGANVTLSPTLLNPFVGTLDNVHVYNRALSGQEICDAWGYGSCNAACPSEGDS